MVQMASECRRRVSPASESIVITHYKAVGSFLFRNGVVLCVAHVYLCG